MNDILTYFRQKNSYIFRKGNECPELHIQMSTVSKPRWMVQSLFEIIGSSVARSDAEARCTLLFLRFFYNFFTFQSFSVFFVYIDIAESQVDWSASSASSADARRNVNTKQNLKMKQTKAGQKVSTY